ncbi:RHS repeat domain-containing protein [[Kitasatospora] papulosa]|uniref:RHS repeat domain-containing protein n=1 Tax=[Kitasatospora] papulosa TaxID=1464011 RepID=UPI0037F8AB1C
MLLSAGSIRCTYDASGRIVARHKARLWCKPDVWQYSWDAEDRLIACRTPDGALWQYSYDSLGRQTAKDQVDEGGAVVHSVHFTWDGTTLVEQTDTAQHTTLTWDCDGYTPLSQLERRTGLATASSASTATDSRFFAIVSDLIGTPTELVDERGEVAWQSRMTVWGTTSWTRTAIAYTPLRFPGQYDDAETGLYYNCYRHIEG